MLLKQLARHQHEPRRAEAALGRARLQEGFLHRAELAIRREVLDGRDLLAVGECREIEAARHGGAVDKHGAAAAQALRAALPRTEEIEPVAQQLENGLMRRDRGRDLLAVKGETYRSHQSSNGAPCAARSAR